MQCAAGGEEHFANNIEAEKKFHWKHDAYVIEGVYHLPLLGRSLCIIALNGPCSDNGFEISMRCNSIPSASAAAWIAGVKYLETC
jgi:hypothetical protein